MTPQPATHSRTHPSEGHDIGHGENEPQKRAQDVSTGRGVGRVMGRAELIKAQLAAAEADGSLVTRGHYRPADAERELATVLPLIAADIEAMRTEELHRLEEPDLYSRGRLWAFSVAARRVRSYLEGE